MMEPTTNTDIRTQSKRMRFALVCFASLAVVGSTLLSFGQRGTATAAEDICCYGYCHIDDDVFDQNSKLFYSDVIAFPDFWGLSQAKLKSSFYKHVEANYPKPLEKSLERSGIVHCDVNRKKRSDAVDDMNDLIAAQRRSGNSIVHTGWSPPADFWD